MPAAGQNLRPFIREPGKKSRTPPRPEASPAPVPPPSTTTTTKTTSPPLRARCPLRAAPAQAEICGPSPPTGRDAPRHAPRPTLGAKAPTDYEASVGLQLQPQPPGVGAVPSVMAVAGYLVAW
ncbi:Protein of unknown function [Gryllus bimaculatus]|nr:Protein of unknown function [Gryllus bimaculatus]